ncbi:hypothetical protein NDA11_005247 [Ustilago hordei]|nr:hypothetical protein NDA10_003509 [Ustilago hordei]KAJ1576930.1 hypothetical protein NDA15_003411 [Ustilago hordei]KAJ1578479.1 hypothetical protein NDA12_000118 [Ustilago hordei]KAJ1584146.1 hypothetical protein NDA11_005247 [Ustilago hordei]KAJ1599290.1 hypothetical protein NDA14_006234 [Ustilago hordei]
MLARTPLSSPQPSARQRTANHFRTRQASRRLQPSIPFRAQIRASRPSITTVPTSLLRFDATHALWSFILRACHDRTSSSRLSYDPPDVGARATATASESADHTASSSENTAFKPVRPDRDNQSSTRIAIATYI